jgi:hypothetical protein
VRLGDRYPVISVATPGAVSSACDTELRDSDNRQNLLHSNGRAVLIWKVICSICVRKLAILSLMIIGALVAGAQGQEKMARRKLPGREKPECAEDSICFSGEVSAGEEFRKPLNDDLEFVLRPVGVDLKQGWGIEVVSRKPEGEGPPPGHCSDALAMVVNGPYRQHNQLLIDMSYGWTAEEEVGDSPREFRFVTNCADFRVERERLLIALGGTNSAGVRVASDEEYWKTVEALGSNARGKGRVWITASKTSRADYSPDGFTKDQLGVSDHSGTILWIKFSVEIKLPKPN